MSDYEFRYRVNQPPERIRNGSTRIAFDIRAVYRLRGSNDAFQVLPTHHRTVSVLASDLKVVNDMPDGTGAQRAAKNAAAKDLIAAGLGLSTYDTPEISWSVSGMQALLDANEASALEADRLDDYIQNVLGTSYPIDFSL